MWIPPLLGLDTAPDTVSILAAGNASGLAPATLSIAIGSPWDLPASEARKGVRQPLLTVDAR
jgi:hypothetical protein